MSFNKPPYQERRIAVFKEAINTTSFNRKYYLEHFKTISTTTASRDLKYATEKGLLIKTGDKRFTEYTFKK